jgi:hypothetical protein
MDIDTHAVRAAELEATACDSCGQPDPLNLHLLGCDDEPEQPATLPDLLRHLAAGLEILPEPISWEWRRYNNVPGLHMHISGVADFEQWRQWFAAPEATPGKWQQPTLSDGIWHRRHISQTAWRGQQVNLLWIENRDELDTRAERRAELVAELAKLGGAVTV